MVPSTPELGADLASANRLVAAGQNHPEDSLLKGCVRQKVIGLLGLAGDLIDEQVRVGGRRLLDRVVLLSKVVAPVRYEQ